MKHYPYVLYPPVNEETFRKSADFTDDISQLLGKNAKNLNILTSLNRYERKKNVVLALEAFANFLKRVEIADLTWGKKKGQKESILVIAGGWDSRVEENIEYEKELL